MRAPLLFFIALMAFPFSVRADGGTIPSKPADPGLSCRFTTNSVIPACLTRTGTKILKGHRVYEAFGVTFPAELRVYELDLAELPGSLRFSITPRGAYIDNPSSKFELFQGDTRFHPARWPAVGFSKEVRFDAGSRALNLPADMIARFTREPDIWIGAYWTADWAYESTRVTKADFAAGKLSIGPLRAPQSIRETFPYFLFNVVAAISKPGDYAFDENAQKVYAAATTDSDEFEIGVERTLLEIDNVRDLTLKDLKLEKALGTALVIRNSENVTIDGCDIRHMGRSAILVDGGKNVVIKNCRIDDIAETAVDMRGGDRRTLTPASHVISNSIIRNFGLEARTYRPAVKISGVGNVIENNIIEHSPHAAILLNGNNHLIKGNIIRDVVTDADDAGAIYIGRDWTERGTIIEDNWFENIGAAANPNAVNPSKRKGIQAIYLDDQSSGITVRRNLFNKINIGVSIHGGRDNLIYDNAFIRCNAAAIWMGKYGQGLTGGTMQQRLDAVPFKSPPWSDQYPLLASIESDRPELPLGNRERGNVAIDCPLYILNGGTDPAYWPGIGQDSRVLAVCGREVEPRKLLESVGLNCSRLPILCVSRDRIH